MGIVSRAQLLSAVAAARQQGARVVMSNGCFDALHDGHRYSLESAATHGDRLVVAVNDDASVRRLKGPGRPHDGLALRMANLAALECVDWVVAFSAPTPVALIDAVAPDVLVKGSDYRCETIAGAAGVLARGGQVVIVDRLPGLSTSRRLAAARDVGR